MNSPIEQGSIQGNRRFNESPIFFIGMIALIILLLFLSRFNSDKNPELWTMFEALAKYCDVAGDRPIIALLKAINYSTIGYAGWFYWRVGGVFLPLISGFFFLSVYFASFYIGLQGHHDESQEHYFFVLRGYGVTLALTLYFWIADYVRYKNSSDRLIAVTLAFSSMYISFPAAI